ncbi:hypothetical protein [Xylophilus ampelinus]|uniref:hypothetical protein n=1 Tax=Xylophilus ampelinus TaxID=54067 RepID=UPI00286F36CC|nr:hypothetical protein [Xylophilus ampelinus]
MPTRSPAKRTSTAHESIKPATKLQSPKENPPRSFTCVADFLFVYPGNAIMHSPDTETYDTVADQDTKTHACGLRRNYFLAASAAASAALLAASFAASAAALALLAAPAALLAALAASLAEPAGVVVSGAAEVAGPGPMAAPGTGAAVEGGAGACSGGGAGTGSAFLPQAANATADTKPAKTREFLMIFGSLSIWSYQSFGRNDRLRRCRHSL